ncbi:MAG: DUF4178 domain-containing protein, partial [Planctomycetota bacterium]
MNRSAETSRLPEDITDIVDDFVTRRQSGDLIEVEKFAAEFPEFECELLAILPTVEYLETSSPFEGLPPENFGDYRLKRFIGSGGMGFVYECESPLREHVALKFMSTGERRLDAQRFEREARVVADLHHPNIVPVFDFGRINNLKYMSMRFIDGPNLSDVLRAFDEHSDPGAVDARIALSLKNNWSGIANIGYQVASALSYAHDEGVLHRDIKPANLIVDKNLKPWVTDFGLAKFQNTDSNLTRTGNAVGTLKYMAPEQLEGESDERSDIYSLGLTLYEMINHGSVSSSALLVPHRMPLPSRSQHTIPAGLEKAILKACHPVPERRYQTAAEFAEKLRRYCNEERRKRTWGSALPMILAVALAIGLFCTSSGKEMLRGLLSSAPAHPVSSFEPTLFDIQIGDIVQYNGIDWEVDGQQIYFQKSWTWQKYLLSHEDRRMWMCVEEDDWLKVIMWTPTDQVRVSGEPPEELIYEDESYHRVYVGESSMTYLRPNKRPTADQCKYFDYQGPGKKWLSVEDWSGCSVVLAGILIDPGEVQSVAGKGRG